MMFDPDLHGHRTAWLTLKLCSRLQMDDATSRTIAAAGRTHDIGKQLVPQTLLDKPGALTSAERATMDKHCLLGARLLLDEVADRAAPPSTAASVALLHHEWWNGCGYPFGLGGTEIPLAARIVAVADVFDALCSARPYKAAWPLERVLDHMGEYRATQFDPMCLDALMEFAPALAPSWQDQASLEALGAATFVPPHIEPEALYVPAPTGRGWHAAASHPWAVS